MVRRFRSEPEKLRDAKVPKRNNSVFSKRSSILRIEVNHEDSFLIDSNLFCAAGCRNLYWVVVSSSLISAVSLGDSAEKILTPLIDWAPAGRARA